jgi:metal-responsive CopG/Arc/MetJ family transcriptional regulator
MSKPNIGIRISPALLSELNNYANRSGTSRTDVIVSEIATYLGCAENVPLNQKMAELEAKGNRSRFG